MKRVLIFLAGCAVGAALLWFVNTRRIVPMPESTRLVQINYFTGEAREVHVSRTEATEAEWLDEDRINKVEEAAQRRREAAAAAAAPPAQGPSPKVKPAALIPKPKVFKIEGETGVITYAGYLESHQSRLSIRLHNGTTKELTRAQFQLDGVDRTTGVPVARTFWVELATCAPATDVSTSTDIPGGGVYGGSTDVTRLEIIKIETKAP